MGDLAKFIANVQSQLGVPYVFGGETPGVGFDCSGLMQWAADAAGFSIPRTSEEQFGALPLVNNPGPGDLVFFFVPGDDQAPPQHVGMCSNLGCSTMIDAPFTGTVVRYDPTSVGPTIPAGGYIMGFGRLPGAGPPVPPSPTPGFATGWVVGSHP